MAAGLRALRRWRLAAAPPGLAFTRSAFVVKKATNAQPNWLGVGLAFGTSAALWALLVKVVLADFNRLRPLSPEQSADLIQQHNEDVMEYERRKQEKGHKCTECS